MLRNWKSSIVLLAVLTFANPHVLACSCVSTADALADLNSADAVFTGEVTALTIAPRWWRVAKVQPPSDLVTPLERDHSARVERVTIAVDRSWKGVTREEVTVYTMFDCCMCGFGFQVGERYLIYARWQEGRGAYFVSSCSRSKTADSAESEFTVLGQAKYDFESGRAQKQVQ